MLRLPITCVVALVAATAAVAQGTPARPHSAVKRAVLESESRRVDAQVTRDLDALGRGIAAEAIYIHANGQTQTRAEYLRDVEAGKSRYRSIELSDRSVAIHRTMAVTHGEVTLNVGVDRRIVARYTGLYVRRDGRWQVLSWQSTPIQPR